jgi:hypothetical protein
MYYLDGLTLAGLFKCLLGLEGFLETVTLLFILLFAGVGLVTTLGQLFNLGIVFIVLKFIDSNIFLPLQVDLQAHLH